MRVLQLHSRYREYGGEERVVENDAALLREAGNEVLTHEVPNPSGGFAAAASLAASAWNVRQARRVDRLIEGWRPDVVHIHNTWFSLSPSIFGVPRRRGVPVVVTIHNYRSVCASADLWRDGRPCHECVGRRFAFGGVRHGCYRDSRILSAVSASASRIQTGIVGELSTGRVVVPSEYLKATLVEGGFREDLFEVCPWTTPDPGVRPSRPSESREVYFVGRLEPETKGIETLVGRWNRARSSGLLDGLRLNLVGSGPLQGSAEVTGPDVRSLGHLDRDELDRLLLSGRALVVPSLWEEPFGLVAIEAFAAGLPVIATDRGALPETVGLLGEECLLPGDDDSAWERGLSWLSDDRFVDTRGARARQVWHERFMPSSGIDRLEGVLAAASGASFGSGS